MIARYERDARSIFHDCPDELARFEALLQQVRSQDGVRAIVLRETDELVHEIAPERFPVFERLRASMPARSPFSFMPVWEYFVTLYLGAKLCFPELPLRDAAYEFVRQGTFKYRNNPLFSIIRRASGDDLASYLALNIQQASVFNFGEYDLIKKNPGRYTLYGAEDYTTLQEPLTVAYHQTLLELFDLEGEVCFRALDERSYALDLSWR